MIICAVLFAHVGTQADDLEFEKIATADSPSNSAMMVLSTQRSSPCLCSRYVAEQVMPIEPFYE